MEKLCVFCGEKPKSKTLEHVIPQWLINETGNPNRKVPFGVDIRTKKLRRFSFDQLRFPACLNCNNMFSALEKEARQVILAIINQGPIDAHSIEIMLTWLDKVRIGLWLGYFYLDKNIYGIIPNFHIINRIGNKDRMVLIYKADDALKGVGFIGVNTPLFGHFPSSFALCINQLYFVNISADFLLSRRLGLPFPAEKTLVDKKSTYMRIRTGLERVITPLLRVSYNRSCTEIYQPIIPRELFDWEELEIYKTPYVKKYPSSSRFGKILIKTDDRQLEEYPVVKSNIWIPDKTFSRSQLMFVVLKTVLTIQNYLLSLLPSLDGLDEAERAHQKNAYDFARKYNNLLLKKAEKELKGILN